MSEVAEILIGAIDQAREKEAHELTMLLQKKRDGNVGRAAELLYFLSVQPHYTASVKQIRQELKYRTRQRFFQVLNAVRPYVKCSPPRSTVPHVKVTLDSQVAEIVAKIK